MVVAQYDAVNGGDRLIFNAGIALGLGTGFVALGLLKYRAPLAKLVPLYNMNTLVTVMLALIIFAEWQQTNTVQLLVGAAFIILGGLLVSGA